MKKIIIYLTLTICSYAFCQTTESSLVLPNINPPSPESSKFIECGNNSANEYTGKLNLSIPIYEYTAGKIKMPISLNYTGAGVKVEDMSSWVGINWNLSVGGLITRQIHDSSDEVYIDRVIVEEEHLKTNANDLCAPDSQYYWGLALNDGSNDTEFDIFSFSFLGYSGSFYLDTNFNPVYLENENEIKIEIIGNYGSNKQNLIQSQIFCITTPDGIKYFFGGNQTESTRVLSGAHNINIDGVTSYFLYRIEHPVNGTIILEYDSIPQCTQDISKSYSMTTAQATVMYPSTFIESKFRTRVYGSKRLRKIASLNNDIEVILTRSDYTNNNFSSVLNNIQIVKNEASASTILKEIDFDYGAKTLPTSINNDFENASRFFLTKIKINNDLDSQGNKHEEYVLEYDSPYSLPNRMSNSRDALGYYNGKYNVSLIPIDPRYNFNQTQQFADLNPIFNHAKKGSLKKITYPTKGYSEFEYEPLPAKKERIVTYSLIINSHPENEENFSNTFTIPGYNNFWGIEGYTNFPTVYQTQYIKFNLSTYVAPHSNVSSMTGKGIEFIITDLTSELSTSYTRVYPIMSNPLYEYELIVGHNYSFQLKFLNNYTSGDFQAITGSVSFSVFEGYDSIEGLGVRLKRQKDYSSANTLVNQKRYYYGSINGAYQDVTKFPFISYYPKQTYKAVGVDQYSYLNITFSSEIVDVSRKTIRNPEIFPVVSTSLGGDNFENGGIEKNFIDIPDTTINRVITENDGCWANSYGGAVSCGLPAPTNQTLLHFEMDYYKTWEKTNNSYYNGKLVSEREYVKKDNDLFKIKESKNDFNLTQDISKTATNFVGRRILTSGGTMAQNYCPQNPTVYLNSMLATYFAYYKTRVLSLKQINSRTINYIDPVSMSDYSPFVQLFIDPLLFNLDFNPDEGLEEQPIMPTQEELEASYRKIVTTQTFEYGVLKGLPTRITTSSSDGSAKSVVNTYVNELSSLSGLNANQITAYNTMVSQNMVGSPIQVQEFKNTTELLSTQRTTYKQDALNHVFPELIKYAKENGTLEDRIVFEEYDSKGNPTLMSYKDGTKIKYLYNSNNQVIAKIENFTGTLDPNTNTITGTICEYINSFPSSMVTVFVYNSNNLLSEIVDNRCQKTTYSYDSLLRLKEIKDNDGNIMQEFDNNYRQN